MKNFTLVEFRLRHHPSTCLKNMENILIYIKFCFYFDQRSLRTGQCFTETELYRGDVTITIAWVVIAAFPFSLSTSKTKYTQWECYFKKYDFYSCCPINIYKNSCQISLAKIWRCGYTMHMWLHMWFEYCSSDHISARVSQQFWHWT